MSLPLLDEETDLGDYTDGAYYLLVNERQLEDLAAGACPASVQAQAICRLDWMEHLEAKSHRPLDRERRSVQKSAEKGRKSLRKRAAAQNV